MESLLTQYAKTCNSKANTFARMGQPQVTYKVRHEKEGYGFFYFANGSSSTTLEAALKIVSLRNIKF